MLLSLTDGSLLLLSLSLLLSELKSKPALAASSKNSGSELTGATSFFLPWAVIFLCFWVLLLLLSSGSACFCELSWLFGTALMGEWPLEGTLIASLGWPCSCQTWLEGTAEGPGSVRSTTNEDNGWALVVWAESWPMGWSSSTLWYHWKSVEDAAIWKECDKSTMGCEGSVWAGRHYCLLICVYVYVIKKNYKCKSKPIWNHLKLFTHIRYFPNQKLNGSVSGKNLQTKTETSSFGSVQTKFTLVWNQTSPTLEETADLACQGLSHSKRAKTRHTLSSPQEKR